MLTLQNALTYTCECSNGPTPNMTLYGQTLPSLECDAWIAQCVNDTIGAADSASEQDRCHAVKCGNKTAPGQAATGGNGGGGSSGSSASGSGGAMMTTSAKKGGSSKTASASAAASSSAAAIALQLGEHYGAGLFAAGGIALFGLAL